MGSGDGSDRLPHMTHPNPQLKFNIAHIDVAELGAHPLLSRAGSSTQKRFRAVYFDTGDDDIWKAGAVLRIRHEGDRNVQVVKGCCLAGTSLQRDEVEHDIDGDFPVLSAARGTCLDRLLKKRRIRDRLTPNSKLPSSEKSGRSTSILRTRSLTRPRQDRRRHRGDRTAKSILDAEKRRRKVALPGCTPSRREGAFAS